MTSAPPGERPRPAPPVDTGRPLLRSRATKDPKDLLAAALAVLLFAAAALVGRYIEDTDHTLFVNWPPLLASWEPHIGPGTPTALAVAVAVVAHGPVLAARLPWRALLVTAWGAAMAWTWSLALVDGWQRGIAGRLTSRYEYLQSIGSFHDIGAALPDFTHHILLHSPHHWPAHVAGHPPAATLTFVLLDRIGLGGGGWAAVWVLTIGASAASAVLVTLRALADEDTARRAAPFLVLAPVAVWAGVSADGYFTAVAAWAIALLTLAATRRTAPDRVPTPRGSAGATRDPHGASAAAVPGPRGSWMPVGLAFGSGLLLGLTLYLSYGLTLMVLPTAGVLLLTRRLRPVLPLLAGAAVLPVIFTVAGFSWWEAYQLLLTRYGEGAGGARPYGYWLWANPACTALITGVATAAGLRRACAAAPGALRRLTRQTGTRQTRAPKPSAPSTGTDRLVVLVLLALLAVLAADLSGMSKAETERIWQPFALWLLPAAALLPPAGRRWWLTAQAVVALLINHLLFTGW